MFIPAELELNYFLYYQLRIVSFLQVKIVNLNLIFDVMKGIVDFKWFAEKG